MPILPHTFTKPPPMQPLLLHDHGCNPWFCVTVLESATNIPWQTGTWLHLLAWVPRCKTRFHNLCSLLFFQTAGAILDPTRPLVSAISKLMTWRSDNDDKRSTYMSAMEDQ
ncbi:hypothetical protein N7G274_002633 [Stereocaulon virgatum]|uniref:Uncharacterized protein n=1 Tax=Stereocaulon virgatum TaxID=373712 RepID=A0ABR4AN34_9LECA